MITDLLARRAKECGDRTFLWSDDGSHSFAQTFVAAKRFAHVLCSHGVGSGDHVALLAKNGAPFVVAAMAINWLGAVTVALNNELVADGLRYTLRQSDARLIVADEDWIQKKGHHLDEGLKALPVVTLLAEQAFFASIDHLPEAEGSSVSEGSPCSILYTSGTTGLPKGVVNSHACYEAVGRDTVTALRLTSDDRILVFLPLFHTNPQMYALMSALTIGCSLIIRPRFSAASFFDDARRFGATGFTFVGTVMSILAIRHAGEQRNHSLRFAVGGGTPDDIWQVLHDRFGFRIFELYGMTEIGGWVSCNTEAEYKLGTCGRLRGSMDVRIFDDDDRELPAGTPGEIVVRSKEPNIILSGYYKKPDAWVQCTRNLWFHTGDRGKFDREGFLYFLGRSKELIRRAGEMISPVEIESKLRILPGVEDCAVVGVPDAILGEEIKAVVVMSEPADPGALINHLASLLPGFMLPRYLEFATAIPKTETEKVQRNKLQYIDASVHDLRTAKA